ncbi:MAG: HD domain-containing protein [Myxococcales bacterium]
MRGVPTGFWGKLREDPEGRVVEWHPLLAHCADVAAVAESLLELPVWHQRAARLAGIAALTAQDRARLCVMAALHDFGKLTIPFQAKGRKDLPCSRGGHVEPAIGAVCANDFAELFEPLGCFGVGAFGLLISALAHHGKPLAAARAGHSSSPWSSQGGLESGQRAT